MIKTHTCRSIRLSHLAATTFFAADVVSEARERHFPTTTDDELIVVQWFPLLLLPTTE